MIKTIIWDWNGTLLNDTDICLESMNSMLGKRNKPTLSKHRYREIFTFPVRDYYIKAGFDFNYESFDNLAVEFMNLYFSRLNNAEIFIEAMEVLNSLKQNDMKQVLISAMEHLSLVSSVKEKGLYGFFDHISGIEDHFAAGKIENARKIVKELKLDLNRTLLIGDTIHDYEVATELGVKCLLIADGHQSMERLENLGCEVAGNLGLVSDIIFSKKTFILS